MKNLINQKELGERLGLSPRKCAELIKEAELPYIYISPQCLRYDLEDCLSALKKRYGVNYDESPTTQQTK